MLLFSSFFFLQFCDLTIYFNSFKNTKLGKHRLYVSIRTCHSFLSLSCLSSSSTFYSFFFIQFFDVKRFIDRKLSNNMNL